MNSQLTRRVLLLSTPSLLAACMTKPIVLDRQAAAGVKRIGLPTVGIPSSPTVTVINSVGNQLGAIGLIAGATVRANRRASLRRIMADRGFDPRASFVSALVAGLSAHGLTVVPFEADPDRARFLTYTPASPAYDAVLDVVVTEYGFVASSDADQDPYRATAAATVHLVATPGNTVLMQDDVYVSKLETPATEGGPNPPRTTFASFSEVEADPASGVAALTAALTDLAGGVVRRAS